MRESWKKMIAQIEKYFHVVPNDNSWSFIISPKKQWAFDMLNRIWINYSGSLDWCNDTHPGLAQ